MRIVGGLLLAIGLIVALFFGTAAYATHGTKMQGEPIVYAAWLAFAFVLMALGWKTLRRPAR